MINCFGGPPAEQDSSGRVPESIAEGWLVPAQDQVEDPTGGIVSGLSWMCYAAAGEGDAWELAEQLRVEEAKRLQVERAEEAAGKAAKMAGNANARRG